MQMAGKNQNPDIYKAQVMPNGGLRMFGLKPGNCLRALGTVGTAALMNRVVAA